MTTLVTGFGMVGAGATAKSQAGSQFGGREAMEPLYMGCRMQDLNGS